MDDHNPPHSRLDVTIGFNAMRLFLERYWERAGRASDDLAVLLGGLQRLENDGLPHDPAMWSDWLQAVEGAIASNRVGTPASCEENKSAAEDQWQYRSMAAVDQFATALRALDRTNPWPNLPSLPRAMNHLMTELWDRGFSQSEIRQAFEDAVADMPRYAAGEEVRR